MTGAVGFIGSNLVDRLLTQGATVTGWDNLATGQLRQAGHAVKEIPLDWIDKDGSKVSLISDSVSMLRSLLKLRRVVQRSRP